MTFEKFCRRLSKRLGPPREVDALCPDCEVVHSVATCELAFAAYISGAGKREVDALWRGDLPVQLVPVAYQPGRLH